MSQQKPLLPRVSRLFLASLEILVASIPLTAEPSAKELLDAVDKILSLPSYASTATLETSEPGATPRSMSFSAQGRTDKGTYMEVSAPARTKGTRFLQLEGSLWMFNPRAGSANAIRLSARDSFQGSAFSNADVGKNRFSEDYEPSLAPEEEISAESVSTPCYVISSAAKTDEAAYGKIMMWIRKSDRVPIKMEYYAKSGLLFKRMELSKVKDYGAITRPSILRMESLEKKGTITTLTLLSMEPRDVPLSVFNKNYLTR
jgi:outer membrane lipoprotein-sorting protein